jgi:hypothetical protein
MLDGSGFKAAPQSWDLPKGGSNRGYAPEQLSEQLILSIWCCAARFVHADITRLDSTLIRLFGRGRAAGYKTIVRLFQRADQASATRVQMSSYACTANANNGCFTSLASASASPASRGGIVPILNLLLD